jgi:hypothetical protein
LLVEGVGKVANEGGGREVLPSLRMKVWFLALGWLVEAGDDRVDEVGDVDEAALVIDISPIEINKISSVDTSIFTE